MKNFRGVWTVRTISVTGVCKKRLTIQSDKGTGYWTNGKFWVWIFPQVDQLRTNKNKNLSQLSSRESLSDMVKVVRPYNGFVGWEWD